MDSENKAFKEIMDSVAICEKLVAIREKAANEFESAVSYQVNQKRPELGCVDQHTIDAFKAHQIYRLMDTLIERGKATGPNNDLDRIWNDLKCLI